MSLFIWGTERTRPEIEVSLACSKNNEVVGAPRVEKGKQGVGG